MYIYSTKDGIDPPATAFIYFLLGAGMANLLSAYLRYCSMHITTAPVVPTIEENLEEGKVTNTTKTVAQTTHTTHTTTQSNYVCKVISAFCLKHAPMCLMILLNLLIFMHRYHEARHNFTYVHLIVLVICPFVFCGVLMTGMLQTVERKSIVLSYVFENRFIVLLGECSLAIYIFQRVSVVVVVLLLLLLLLLCVCLCLFCL